uniref:Protein preY, mitochondrial n=1 Tax=Rhizophora mucronata TaxID=61149 RepID=A0A2P2JBS9_RHIMU
MVRLSKALLKDAGNGMSKTLLEILVCPLSKQPLRYCEESNSLISDAIGVSYPIKDGIPCLGKKKKKKTKNRYSLSNTLLSSFFSLFVQINNLFK